MSTLEALALVMGIIFIWMVVILAIGLCMEGVRALRMKYWK